MREALLEIIQDPELVEGEDWRRRRVMPNEVIVSEGDRDRRMYLIESGALRVSGRVELEDSRHIQPGLCDLGAGELFGELTLFDDHPRTASVVALSEGRLLEFDCVRLSAYLERHPQRGYALLKAMYRVMIGRLGKANRRVEHLFAWGLKAHGIDRYL